MKIARNQTETYEVFSDMFYTIRSNDSGTTFGLDICKERNHQETLFRAVHYREII
jgi:hypothetical protein